MNIEQIQIGIGRVVLEYLKTVIDKIEDEAPAEAQMTSIETDAETK